jgi:hypothetical protein
MSIQEVSAEQLAELFRHYHQALGPDFGSSSKPNAEAWTGTTTGKEPSGRCPSGIAGIGLNGQRTGKPKALFRKAG